jgi:hypothetical protein
MSALYQVVIYKESVPNLIAPHVRDLASFQFEQESVTAHGVPDLDLRVGHWNAARPVLRAASCPVKQPGARAGVGVHLPDRAEGGRGRSSRLTIGRYRAVVTTWNVGPGQGTLGPSKAIGGPATNGKRFVLCPTGSTRQSYSLHPEVSTIGAQKKHRVPRERRRNRPDGSLLDERTARHCTVARLKDGRAGWG